MSPLATKGEVWRICLENSLVSLADVVAWSDGQIQALNDPPHWLIQLACTMSIADAISVLNGRTGEIDETRVWPELADRCLKVLDSDPKQEHQVARALHFLADDHRHIPTDIVLEMRSFWDEINLAHHEVYGVLDEVRSRLMTFLARNSDQT